MVAPDLATVSELNARARSDRVTAGEVANEGLVADGQVAGTGDEVVTRENNRLLATGRRWVQNGDRWVVRTTNPEGTMAVRRLDGKGEVVLPAAYVRHHVELAFATTATDATQTFFARHSMFLVGPVPLRCYPGPGWRPCASAGVPLEFGRPRRAGRWQPRARAVLASA